MVKTGFEESEVGYVEVEWKPNETTRPLFVDFYYFLVKKGKCFKLYV
jgi:hypothetical protein